MNDIQLGYALWNYYEDINDWSDNEMVELKAILKLYPLKIYGVFDYHKLRRNNIKVSWSTLPKKFKQVFGTFHQLRRYAGAANPSDKEIMEAYQCSDLYVPNYREVDVYGISKELWFKAPNTAYIDIPLPFSSLGAHFCHNFIYYVYCPESDPTYKLKKEYQEFVKDFLQVVIISDIEEWEDKIRQLDKQDERRNYKNSDV